MLQRKERKNDGKQNEKLKTVPDTSENTETENKNGEEASRGMNKEKNVSKSTDDDKGKKKNKKSQKVTKDDTRQTDGENNKPKTCSTTV